MRQEETRLGFPRIKSWREMYQGDNLFYALVHVALCYTCGLGSERPRRLKTRLAELELGFVTGDWGSHGWVDGWIAGPAEPPGPGHNAGFLTIRGNGADFLSELRAASSFRKRRSNTVSCRSLVSPLLFLLIFNGDQGHIANLQAAAGHAAAGAQLRCVAVAAPMRGHF